MRTREYDPLQCIPSPEHLRQKLREAKEKARKLEILLDVSTRINDKPSGDQLEVVPCRN